MWPCTASEWRWEVQRTVFASVACVCSRPVRRGSVLVHLCGWHGVPRMGSCLMNGSSFLTISEAGKSKDTEPAAGKGLLTVSSHGDGERKSP